MVDVKHGLHGATTLGPPEGRTSAGATHVLLSGIRRAVEQPGAPELNLVPLQGSQRVFV